MADISNEISLVYRNWKKNLTLTPSESELSLVSIYDLLYDESGELWGSQAVGTEGASAASLCLGTKLSHDIICFNNSMLTIDGSVDTSVSINLSLFATYGIDIALADYDARAKQYIGDINTHFLIGTEEYKLFNNDRYYLYDKDSAIAPRYLSLFNRRSILFNTIDGGNSPTFETLTPPIVAPLEYFVGSEASLADKDIYLSQLDTVFASTLALQDNFTAYNRIFLSPNSNYTKILLMRALGLNYIFFFDTAFPRYNEDYGALLETSEILDLTSTSNSTIPNILGQELWFRILKNTYVWVRAPFYGDYINQESFQQELSPNSKVVHNELMVSGDGDFNRYDKWMFANTTQVQQANEEGRSEYTMPYIPRTSPTVDLVTREFLKDEALLSDIMKYDANGDITSVFSEEYLNTAKSSVIKNWLTLNVYNDASPIGSLPSPPLNRFTAAYEQAELEEDGDEYPYYGYNYSSKKELFMELGFTNYFDTESRKGDSQYQSMGKFPSIIPKHGNAYIDGRIISPTIDEIWVMLKKLIGGRKGDRITIENVESPSDIRAAILDYAVPFSNEDKKKNLMDTTMNEVPQSEYNFQYGKYTRHGDPIDWEYISPKDAEGEDDRINQMYISITKFVNQNDSIVYPIYNALKHLDSQVHLFYGEGREITKFPAWNRLIEDSELDDSLVEILNDSAISSLDTIWSPREAPMSLRELEALIMGNKFNIITLARFLKENFTLLGPLGKSTYEKYEDSSSPEYIDWKEELEELSDNIFSQRDIEMSISSPNISSGTLYQLHKDYNFNPISPNTWYNRYGKNEGDEALGAKAIFRDMDSRNTEETKTSLFGKEETQTFTRGSSSFTREVRLGRFTDTVYTSRLREEYGSSPAINPNQDIIGAENVYMAADGTWRHIADHVRIPILKCRF